MTALDRLAAGVTPVDRGSGTPLGALTGRTVLKGGLPFVVLDDLGGGPVGPLLFGGTVAPPAGRRCAVLLTPAQQWLLTCEGWWPRGG